MSMIAIRLKAIVIILSANTDKQYVQNKSLHSPNKTFEAVIHKTGPYLWRHDNQHKDRKQNYTQQNI